MAGSQPGQGVPPIQQIWSQALAEYTTQLENAGQPVDLEKWKDVKDVDQLVERLEVQHGEFDKDVGRGSKVTSAIKMGFAPVTLLMNTLGGPASAAFPPCSQIFGAVSVLIAAAKKTGAAFDDIAGLFNDLGKSTQLIKPLTKRKPPPQLEQIIQGILVCLLSVCALATKRTCHVSDNVKKHRTAKQLFSGVRSNTTQFAKQLFLGEDAEINAAKGKLRDLSASQAQLVGVLTFEKVGDIQDDVSRFGAVAVDIQSNTARMESVVVSINGLSLEISSAVVELQGDVSGIRMRLAEVGEVIHQMDFKLDDIRENMLTRDDQKESLAMITERFDALERLARQNAGASKPEKSSLSKNTIMHSKRLQQLKVLFKPEPANRSFYRRIANHELIPGTGDWILQRTKIQDWMAGKQAVVSVSGGTGCGKTFLAARIVKEILATHTRGAQSPSVAYFFAKSELKELASVVNILCTTAYQVSQNDTVYAGYLESKLKDKDPHIFSIDTLWRMLFMDYFADARGTTFLILDAFDVCPKDEVEALLQAFKASQADDSKGWPSCIRLLLVHNSTLAENIRGTFSENMASIAITNEDMKADVTTAVDQRLASAWNGKAVTASLYDEVRHAVLSAPQANFLWSCLVIEDLVLTTREDVVRTRLQNLPADVNEAMFLLLSRLSRSLDEFDIEDLNDLVAWVEVSHDFLSLSTLDAILTLRKPGGARIINLDHLVKNDYAGIFICTPNEDEAENASEDKIRQRLQDGVQYDDDEGMSVADGVSVRDMADPNRSTRKPKLSSTGRTLSNGRSNHGTP